MENHTPQFPADEKKPRQLSYQGFLRWLFMFLQDDQQTLAIFRSITGGTFIYADASNQETSEAVECLGCHLRRRVEFTKQAQVNEQQDALVSKSDLSFPTDEKKP
ncbi:hypothetical protein [Marinomonas sp. GJ51-6]|uniref:hypothetical protein n=1 Tax=Marinomonas sp. GJ51-6 TaxID=2992802 RepID=UPI0029351E5E|nr:hypothetical protein [Marinomonas sp. GJ51-6]WOD08783.1 hypothetical protein ONZ50_06885 [Marinomonas sp. GJ51-6]